MHCGPDPDANLGKALERIKEAAKKGAKIVCLQELFRSQYFCQTEDPRNFALAETIPGPTTKRLSDAAKKQGVVIVASLFEKRAQGLYHNTAVVIDADGSLVGKYRKMHIPEDPRFYEKFYFAPGDLGFKAFDTRFGRIGVLVCWDQWYPEAARLTALQGAQILFYPTAIGTWIGEKEHQVAQHDAWQTIQRSHAVANGVFVAVPNRVGREGELDFWGHSFVANPFGEVVAKASEANEEILYADCDLGDIERFRHGWPFLRDRRIDAYGPITQRFMDA
ncbi:MAG: carbon-nitrogen hydrolase [Euryarchaeota archaeon]|nr:carbon-nitrogen hydrolase [Euryarchaeota archaeon]